MKYFPEPVKRFAQIKNPFTKVNCVEEINVTLPSESGQSLKLVSEGSLKLVFCRTSIKDSQAPYNGSSILNLTQLSRTYYLSQ
jgi:hypothetical protein